jgi:hypothetical protein
MRNDSGTSLSYMAIVGDGGFPLISVLTQELLRYEMHTVVLSVPGREV